MFPLQSYWSIVFIYFFPNCIFASPWLSLLLPFASIPSRLYALNGLHSPTNGRAFQLRSPHPLSPWECCHGASRHCPAAVMTTVQGNVFHDPPGVQLKQMLVAWDPVVESAKIWLAFWCNSKYLEPSSSVTCGWMDHGLINMEMLLKTSLFWDWNKRSIRVAWKQRFRGRN